ncbi:MAG: hypothetical protein ACI8RD_011037 [Bacillariaceae sp.]|jgi:hypothetical protein
MNITEEHGSAYYRTESEDGNSSQSSSSSSSLWDIDDDDFISQPLIAPGVMSNMTFPITQDDADIVDTALANEIASLNIMDHDKVSFDVHGLDRVEDNEEPEQLQEKFSEFNNEMKKLLSCEKNTATTAAMKEVLELYPDFVEDKILMFLRSVRFNAKSAARKMVNHFQEKKDKFGNGDGVMGRDVELSDLSRADMNILESGMLQVLPIRDTAGRFIFVVRPAMLYRLKERGEGGGKVGKVWFYIFSKLLKDEEFQKKGMVMILYMVGLSNSKFPVASIICPRRKAIPYKINAIHICYDDNNTRPLIAMQKLYFLSKCDRARLRSHFGDHNEAIFKLQTYGIPVNNNYIQPDGYVSLKFHQEWVMMQKSKENQNLPVVHSTIISNNVEADDDDYAENITVGQNDVLFGKHKQIREHPGNRDFCILVQTYQVEYEQATKFGKTAIAERIVSLIHAEYGGRFLKFNKDEASWDEVGRYAAREKISHYFRQLRKKNPVKYSSSSSSSSTNKRDAPPLSVLDDTFGDKQDHEEEKLWKKSRQELNIID